MAVSIPRKERNPPRLLNNILQISTRRSWEYIYNTLLIIDEPQLSFTYNTLWNDLIKSMPDPMDNRSFIIPLLSSYGSPSAGAVPPAPRYSLVILSPNRRISIRALLHPNHALRHHYARKEFDDAFSRYCQTVYCSHQSFLV